MLFIIIVDDKCQSELTYLYEQKTLPFLEGSIIEDGDISIRNPMKILLLHLFI